MSDRERLLDWFDKGFLLRPAAGEPDSVHLALALNEICRPGGEPDETASRLKDLIGEAEHYIFVLADGLGMNLVEGLPAGSFLRRNLALEMRSVFPSSTAPAITSLATGRWPGEHGALGWFQYLPERDLQTIALPFVERFTGRSLTELEVSMNDLFHGDSIFEGFRCPSFLLMPQAIEDSAYTRRIAGGATVNSYDDLDDAIETLLHRVQAGGWSTFTYFYFSRIDSTGHVHGPGSRAVRAEVEALDAALNRLATRLNGRARIIVSADHGQYDVEDRGKLLLHPEDDLTGLLLAPPSGESRVPLFHVRSGRQEEFAERFRQVYGEHFVLLEASEVEELHLLGPGPLSPIARLRLGDFMGLSCKGEALVFSPDQGIIDMLGYHGGLEPAEVRIPLVIG